MSKTIDAVEQQCQFRRDQLETALHEMIETIEDYFGAVPFQFIEGREATPAEFAFRSYVYRFHNFESWTERWMALIEPETTQLQEQKSDLALLALYALKFGSYLGILVGAKTMGATRNELERIGQGLVHSIMGGVRYHAEEAEGSRS